VGKRGGGIHTAFQWVNLKERGNLDNLRRWKYDVKRDLKERGWEGMDWTDLGQVTDK
jgi:hypothetical protein